MQSPQLCAQLWRIFMPHKATPLFPQFFPADPVENPVDNVDKCCRKNCYKGLRIKLCKLYYPPFNFERTGCKGCPFALDLQKELDVLGELLPNERKQCELLWKPVYEEYRKIGYRLRKKNEFLLFDL